jgi:catechol 2,3-dioxygenase-like lactoylglutathione lyase family enzyme
MRAESILETVIYAEDPQACGTFYTRVFGLSVQRAVPGRFCFLRCGGQMLLIFAPGPASDPAQQHGIPAHGAVGAGHLCFRAVDSADLGRWRRHFESLGIPIEHQHQWEGGGRSIYIRDPAGNSVEVAEAAIWGI